MKFDLIIVFATIFYVIFIYFLFLSDFIFNKISHPRRVTINKCDKFSKNKVEKMSTVLSLKRKDCLLRALPFNKVFQIINSIDYLIPSIFVSL